jgi:hypothetical protein
MMPMPQQPHPPPISPAKATANLALQLTLYRTTAASPVVPNAQAAMALPAGCLVGFIDPVGTRLVHVMIHVGVGWAAGTNNGSMFPAQQGGVWQLINLTSFFGSIPHIQRNIGMIYRTINGTGL